MPQAVDKMILEMIMENKKVLKAITEVDKKQNKLGKNQDKIAKSLKLRWLKVAGAIAGVGVLIKKGFDFAKQFAGFKQGMDALARNTGQNADKIVGKLREVSKGTISNRDLMLSANRLVALNVTKDVGQMAKLLEIARVKAKAMGIDTTQAFQDISTGIGRNSPLILDNLGIITKGWAEEAKAAGVAMDSQFILNKILKQGTEELKLAGAGAITHAERIQRMAAQYDNLKTTIGEKLAPVLDSFLTWVEDASGLNLDLTKSAEGVAEAYKNYKTVLDQASKSTENLTEHQQALQNVQILGKKAELFKSIDILNRSYDKQIKTIASLEKKSVSYNKAVKESEEALNKARESGSKSVRVNVELGVIWKNLERRTLNLAKAESLVATTRLKGIQADVEAKRKKAELAQEVIELAELSIQMTDINLLEFISQEKLRKSVEARIQAIKDGRVELQKERDISGPTAPTLSPLEKKVQKDKATIEDFYEFVENQRQIDLIKEQEAFLKAKEGLDLLIEEKKLTEEQGDLLREEAFDQHIENMNRIADRRVEKELINAKDIQGVWNTAVGNIVGDYADGFTEMIFSGQIFKKSFSDLFKDLIIQAGKLIFKLLIIKTLGAIFTGGVGSFLGFAEGTDSAPGGPAIVGEKGPELMHVPKGSRITPNHKVDWSRIGPIPGYADGVGDTTSTSIDQSEQLSIGTLIIQANNPREMYDQLQIESLRHSGGLAL